ncbi:glycosyltransferase family 4 protein [Paenibacillus alginolyticus]|uniref:Glycosyltransferase family 4 protein n=1 Tax=Paenibacillus alginolyticus TaxID=59839 RepID=A0ABT4GIY6_9BACL|nr:glycosyltransferase family 4 protein [Paenibacillus alginolyticus]MCY9696130.1 glycosyltransferase family 4 protein [Paenibacillus alginolyticus]MEC0143283.1 glycosyltransferase family 4 protein [Paenibacillus alginolyticus]
MTNEYEGNIVGGLGIVAINLSKVLAKRNGIFLTIICKGASREVTVENYSSIRVIRFPSSSKYHSVSRQKFNAVPIARWLQAHGFASPDLIHIHSLQCDELAKHYKHKYRIPVIYTCHSLVVLEKRQRGQTNMAARQKKLIRIANAITVPSQWQKMKNRQYYPFYKGQIKVIQNAVSMKNEMNKPAFNPYHLLYVGRLTAVKGIKELLHAISLLKKINQHVKLDIVGKGSRAYTIKLKKIAHKLNINKNVKWIGKLKPMAVQRLYSSYGAVIVPSRHESFGLVALEAMANGAPLVSTRKGGLHSFVNKNNASVIRTVTASNIASSVREIWRNPELTISRVRVAKDTANRYGWAKISNQYFSLFSRYVKGRRINVASTSLEIEKDMENEAPRPSMDRPEYLGEARLL